MKTRRDIRHNLKDVIEPALVGPGLPCRAVSASPPARLDGQSPLVFIQSAGSTRVPLTFDGAAATYHLLVTVLVLHTAGERSERSEDGEGDGAWDEDDAEDALDGIEALIAGVVAAHQKTAAWSALTAGRSTADLIVISGVPYRREVIPVDVEVLA